MAAVYFFSYVILPQLPMYLVKSCNSGVYFRSYVAMARLEVWRNQVLVTLPWFSLHIWLWDMWLKLRDF